MSVSFKIATVVFCLFAGFASEVLFAKQDRLQVIRKAAERAGGILVAPVYVPLAIGIKKYMQSLAKNNPGLILGPGWDVSEEDISEYKADLVGWAVLTGGQGAVTRAYFIVGRDGFWSLSEKALGGPAKKVLLISSFKDGDKVLRSVDILQERLSQQGFVVSRYNVHDLAQFKNQMATLPWNSQFDRIELFMHGSAGEMWS